MARSDRAARTITTEASGKLATVDGAVRQRLREAVDAVRRDDLRRREIDIACDRHADTIGWQPSCLGCRQRRRVLATARTASHA